MRTPGQPPTGTPWGCPIPGFTVSRGRLAGSGSVVRWASSWTPAHGPCLSQAIAWPRRRSRSSRRPHCRRRPGGPMPSRRCWTAAAVSSAW
uniref:Uncharacterized protein n=1 Tax=uncultured marine virus TaxID=186617 RepID=A0A0F7L6K6_9VIRU|nr:hypothetical protein [uncultured marine virus]